MVAWINALAPIRERDPALNPTAVLLLDSCFGATAANDNPWTVLAAAPLDRPNRWDFCPVEPEDTFVKWSPETEAKQSFTRQLIDCFKASARQGIFLSIAELHGLLADAHEGGLLASLPVHTEPYPSVGVTASEKLHEVFKASPWLHASGDKDGVTDTDTRAKLRRMSLRTPKSSPRDRTLVSLAIRFSTDCTKPARAVERLLTRTSSGPRASLASIKVDYVLPGRREGTRIVMVRVSVALWSVMISHPAVTFISYSEPLTVREYGALDMLVGEQHLQNQMCGIGCPMR